MNAAKSRTMSLTAVAIVLSADLLPAGQMPSPPDLTRDNAIHTVDRKRTYNLGATGMRGWIYTKPAGNLDAQNGRTTAASRQILVTHVGNGSPADGVMQMNDVILGVGGRKFDSDARRSIAKAIQDAEKEENGGALKLHVWRVPTLTPEQRQYLLKQAAGEAIDDLLEGGRIEEPEDDPIPVDTTAKVDEEAVVQKNAWRLGETVDVELRLRVMGTYSHTAPYDCPKSARIFEEACNVLVREEPKQTIWQAVNGLALMATGKPELLAKAGAMARAMVAEERVREGGGSWELGYINIFLGEYYLLTGDKEVLPAVEVVTRKLTRGQGMFGTFGHGCREKWTADGELHGPVPPYGPVNQTGLTANMGIVMGAKCGIRDSEVALAIERASNFFAYYVGKGAIPYGEHVPWMLHENNGKSAIAAVFFGLQPDRPRETRYYAQMAVAGFKNREYGHTGQGFSYLWGSLGANIGGPAAASAFFREASTHFDLVRRCDGSFTYDGGEQYGGGKTDDDTYYGNSGYSGLSPTASYVLTYSLPLKKLLITGRDADRDRWLSGTDISEAIAAGHFDLARRERSVRELVAALGYWSPVVREWAAEELARRPDAKQVVPELITMAETDGDLRRRQGATVALGLIRAPEAPTVLAGLLTSDDRWLRFRAAEALHRLGGAAKPVFPDMLKALITNAEPARPIPWDDPVQLAQHRLVEAVFQSDFHQALAETDRDLRYAAIRVAMASPNGRSRSQLAGVLNKVLTLEDVQALAPEILAATRVRAPADQMFGNVIRMAGFKTLTKHRFKEGIEAGVNFAKTQGGHGSEKRTGEIMEAIVPYGSAARRVVPELKELIEELNEQVKQKRFPGGELNNRRVKAVEDAIKAIEAATDHPELRSIKQE